MPEGLKTLSVKYSVHGRPDTLLMISASAKYPVLQYSHFSPGANRSGRG